MAVISSSHSCNFISISKRQQTFGHATTGLQLKGQAQCCSLRLKNNIAKITASGFRNIDNHNSRKFDRTHGDLMMGELLNDGLVYQYHFLVKSYELGPDNNMTIFAIVNQLQESKLNHLKSCGLVNEGYGRTLEMDKRGLIWVVHKLQVEVHRYPSGNDVVQLSTWSCLHGKNSYRRNWILHDHKTGEVLIRAICFYVLMNKETRKLSKFSDEIKEEINPYFLDCDPIIKEDNIISRKLDVDSDDCNHTYLVTRLSDLDMNQHVNNASYINFILESAPRWLSENHQLSAVTIKYLKECGRDSKLQSLSMPIKNDDNGGGGGGGGGGGDHSKEEDFKFHHSLLADGLELVRGTTIWTSKPT